MSINKEFQVRHGLSVNNTVLTANVLTNRVGINTSNAQYTLDVNGSVNIANPTLLVAGINVLSSISSSNSYAVQIGAASNGWANSVGTAGNNYTNAVGLAGNNYTNAVGVSGNNYSIEVGVASNTWANSIGVSSNSYAIQIGSASNTWANSIGIAGNNYTNAVGVAGNNYAIQIGDASNNWSNTVGLGGNNYTNAVGVAGNNYSNFVGNSANSYSLSLATSGNSYSIQIGSASNNWANTIGTAGNNYTDAVGVAGNNYTDAVGVAGNNYTVQVGSASNTWANTIGTAGNNYTNAVGIAGNNYTNAVGLAGNNYTDAVGLAANNYANATYFQKTGGTISGAVSVAGNFTVTGNLTVTGNTSFISVQNYRVDDPLIYIAGNNYTSDVVDIGFIANYVNTTGSNVHTGLYREHENKEWYLFQGYDQEPSNNHIGPLSNNMTLAVLNADLRTGNLNLGGINAIPWIASAFDKANSANVLAYNTGIGANAYTVSVGAAVNSYSIQVGAASNTWSNTLSTIDRAIANAAADSANTYTVTVGAASNAWANSIGTAGNNYTNSVGVASNNWSNTLSTIDRAIANAAANSANVYTLTVGVSGNNYSDSVGLAGNNYTNQVGAAANTWANTKLSNGTVTLAGALTTTGQIYANSQINVTATGGDEGGEIQIQSPGNYTNWSIDAYQNNYRVFARTGTTVSNVNIFHATGGSIRMGVNRTDPDYTVDVGGTINASAIFVNGVQLAAGTVDLTPSNNWANTVSQNWANTRLANVIAGGPITVSWTNTNGYTNATINVSTSGVTATTYGGSTNIPVITVDSYGRITSASNIAVQGMDYAYANSIGAASNTWSNTKVASITGTSGQIFVQGTTTPTLNLVSTGVGANDYGGATQIPVFKVDTFGRLTYAANVPFTSSSSVDTSDSPPISPTDGMLWWNSSLGKLFIYYDDGNSSQWVDAAPPVVYLSDPLVTVAFDVANNAYTKANSANVLAYNTGIGANSYANTVASQVGIIANAAFDKANTSGPKSEWIIKNTNYTANVGDKIYCNTLAGFITITLPASPGIGNNVFVASGYNASNANVTIERNGSTIMGLSENLVITETNISVDFVYDGSSWRIA